MIAGEVQAQKTDVYTSNERIYYEALDLFRKEKYGAAQKKFQNFIKELGVKGELRIQAESYNALCALYLFNRDAEHYLLQFIEDHPDYAKMYLMYYELGNYYYRLKKYEKAISGTISLIHLI